MAPTYKLTYFDGPWLGETIRFMLSYGNFDWEDKRISFEEWQAIKETTPFGKIPILEHDGRISHQNVAICRFLAKKVDLDGKDDWENMEIDAAVDTISDLRMQTARLHLAKDETVKELIRQQLFEKDLPYILKKLDATVKANNGHLALGRLTWADIYYGASLDSFELMSGQVDIFKDYPNLKALQKKVLELPAIKAWIEKRPKVQT